MNVFICLLCLVAIAAARARRRAAVYNHFMRYSPLLQSDKRWALISLGLAAEITIGSAGCVITCFAMMLGTTPDDVNTRLKNLNGFTGADVDSFDVSALDQRVHMIEDNRQYVNSPLPAGVLQALLAYISPESPVIIQLQVPAPYFTHYVLAVDKTPDNKIIILDPAYGDVVTLDRYGSNYAVVICQYVRYFHSY